MAIVPQGEPPPGSVELTPEAAQECNLIIPETHDPGDAGASFASVLLACNDSAAATCRA